MDGGYPIQLDLPAMEEVAKEDLNGFFEPWDGLVTKIVKVGDPASEIVQFAEQNRVGLIM